MVGQGAESTHRCLIRQPDQATTTCWPVGLVPRGPEFVRALKVPKTVHFIWVVPNLGRRPIRCKDVQERYVFELVS